MHVHFVSVFVHRKLYTTHVGLLVTITFIQPDVTPAEPDQDNLLLSGNNSKRNTKQTNVKQVTASIEQRTKEIKTRKRKRYERFVITGTGQHNVIIIIIILIVASLNLSKSTQSAVGLTALKPVAHGRF